MFDWIRDWWYGDNKTVSLSHAARNAPNEGIGIKELIANKPAEIRIITASELATAKSQLKEPAHIILSHEEILMQRNRLRKTVSEPVISSSGPRTLMTEINEIMQTGNRTYFDNLRKRKEKRDIVVSILDVKVGGFIETSALDDLQLL